MAFTERGPTFQIKISKPSPVIAKAKEAFIVQYLRPISDDPVIRINHVQPPLRIKHILRRCRRAYPQTSLKRCEHTQLHSMDSAIPTYSVSLVTSPPDTCVYSCVTVVTTHLMFPSLEMGLRELRDFTAIIPISVIHTVRPKLNIPLVTSISNGVSSSLFPFGTGPRDLGRSTVFSKGSSLLAFFLRGTTFSSTLMMVSSDNCTEGGGVVGGRGGGGSSSCPFSCSSVASSVASCTHLGAKRGVLKCSSLVT